MIRIGIDVGGTNTDAVLVDDTGVVASVKAPTTADVTGGIVAALRALAERAPMSARAEAVMVGTTHFVNAVVQRRDLEPVAAVRIGAPATTALPPFCDWPEDLAQLVVAGAWFVSGGHEYDGRRFAPLDKTALRRAAREIAAAGVKAIAVTGLFSPLDPADEVAAAAILAAEHPAASITCSHELGRIGLLERENATLLNAALGGLARRTVEGFRVALAESGIRAPLFITQNDGTVAEADLAARFPVFSFASGATNSMRGAAFLSGLDDALVADVGGTTTDFGHLRLGFPREANASVEIGGVRTLFRMPDLLSIGLGGGSLVQGSQVGPTSVGYRLPSEARVFGGQTLTATDVAVAAGLARIGDPARMSGFSEHQTQQVLRDVRAQLEAGLDRVKVEGGDAVLIAVGGGAFLIPDALEGVSQVVRVPHGDCANAVGAAIAQISGEVDQIYQGLDREVALASATELATSRAIAAGAAVDTIQTVDLDDIPIPYLPGNARRVRVRVVGAIAAA